MVQYMKQHPATIFSRLRKKEGIVLYEVLLAVLILTVGIVAALGAFRHTLAITKRSRELFEARFVANEALFFLWAAPADAEDRIIGRGKWDPGKVLSPSLVGYTVDCTAEEVSLPFVEETEGEIRLEIPPVRFMMVDAAIYADDARSMQINLFQVFPDADR